MHHSRMTYPTVAQTDFPIGDLLARIRELEAELAAERASKAAPAAVPKPKKSLSKRAPDDFRTAAELWLAGEAVERLPPKAYKAGTARVVAVTFADGQTVRLSTYLPGADGIAAAVRTARTVRQGKPERATKPWENPDWYRTGTWVRDARGAWRLVDPAPCPAVVSAEFVA